MKASIITFIIIFQLSAHAAPAMPLQVKSQDGWTFFQIDDVYSKMFSGNAEASLTYGPSPDGPLITVLVYKTTKPDNVILDNDLSSWRRFVAPNRPKDKVFAEKVINYNGKLRYYLEYQVQDKKVPGRTSNKSVLAVVTGNDIHVFSYQADRQDFIDTIEIVKNMYHNLELQAPPK